MKTNSLRSYYTPSASTEVLVFRTSVQTPEEASQLSLVLDRLAGVEKWNFALDDCDRILRVVSNSGPQAVIQSLYQNGYWCEELED